jgi:hypothetical protein
VVQCDSATEADLEVVEGVDHELLAVVDGRRAVVVLPGLGRFSAV